MVCEILIPKLTIDIIPCAELQTTEHTKFFFDVASPHHTTTPLIWQKVVVTTQESIFFFNHPYKYYSASHIRIESQEKTMKKDDLDEKISPQNQHCTCMAHELSHEHS